jgi:hypothetical protein
MAMGWRGDRLKSRHICQPIAGLLSPLKPGWQTEFLPFENCWVNVTGIAILQKWAYNVTVITNPNEISMVVILSAASCHPIQPPCDGLA